MFYITLLPKQLHSFHANYWINIHWIWSTNILLLAADIPEGRHIPFASVVKVYVVSSKPNCMLTPPFVEKKNFCIKFQLNFSTFFLYFNWFLF